MLWVVGASSGLGAAIAVDAAKHGAKIVLTARRKKELEKVKTSCLDAGRYWDMKTGDVLVLPLDITNTGDLEGAVKTVIKKMGKISSVMLCVGKIHRERWERTDMKTDRELLELNTLSQVSLSRLVVPHMVERNNGSFGIVLCVEAILGAPFSGTFVASKQVKEHRLKSDVKRLWLISTKVSCV